MKITKRQLKRIIREEYSRLKRRGLIREFGEDDAQLRQKLQNRDKMVGRGMDMGTMPFNPNWDYDTKPSSSRKKRKFISDELSQVKYVIEENDMFSWLEVEGTNDPNKIYLMSGELKVIVTNDYGTFKFVLGKPRGWGRWQMECDSIDAEIEDVLQNLLEFVNEKEGNND
jgi:hypothetical protein